MMSRRLLIAKKLLKYDGVFIITIDDNELYFLGCILTEIFPEFDQFIVSIEHNRRGRRGKNFAKSNEYAIFLVRKGLDVISEDFSTGLIGGETRNLRRTGSSSLRSERWRKYFPIYVNPNTMEVLCAGEPLPLNESTFYIVPENIRKNFQGAEIEIIWPIDENGIEKNWHYGLVRTREAILEGKLQARKQDYGLQIYYQLRKKESKKFKTIWTGAHLDASTHGTELVENIIGRENPFDYPKSIYAVIQTLKAACSSKSNALILDFFAGSGTTLNAVNLMNYTFGSNYRCIMVTNNELSEPVSKSLMAEGFLPGDKYWEENGICKFVTWPRTKYTVLGRRDDGSKLTGEYLTGRNIIKNTPRKIKQLAFIDKKHIVTLSQKKELVALIGSFALVELKENVGYFISSNNTGSILFEH